MQNVEYIISENVVFSEDNQKYGDGIIFVYHIITGRKYKVTSALYRLILYFKYPATIKAVSEINRCERLVDPICFDSNIKYLIDKNIIVDNLKIENRILSVENTIFQIRKYSSNVLSREIVFLGIPFGLGNKESSKCGQYPFYIRELSNFKNLNIRKFQNYNVIGARCVDNLKQHIIDDNISDIGNLYINLNEDISYSYRKITESIKSLLLNNKIPFVIGGDHSITSSIINAYSGFYEDFIIFHFDAHLDTYQKIDNKLLYPMQNYNHANFMKSCLICESVKHVYHFGIRGINNINSFIDSKKQTVIWADDFSKIDVSSLNLDLPVYITFDIDFFDDMLAPATVTPVVNGCNYRDLMSFFDQLYKKISVVGVDLVEINPDLDKFNKTSELSFLLMLSIINIINI